MTTRRVSNILVSLFGVLSLAPLHTTTAKGQAISAENVEYRVLATNESSTMEKELNDAAEVGFRLHSVTVTPRCGHQHAVRQDSCV